MQLEAVRYRLAQANIMSPFDAFVVEGDLKKRLGAPVMQGDILFKVARLDKLYVESKVDERDIHEIEVGAMMEIAFTSQPKHKFPARVILIEPVATTETNENVFIMGTIGNGTGRLVAPGNGRHLEGRGRPPDLLLDYFSPYNRFPPVILLVINHGRNPLNL